MNNKYFNFENFVFEITQDGSPTLKLSTGGESMHHSGGAAAETKYIYKSAIDQLLAQNPKAEVCVVGLGLGYIEICWAISVIENNAFESQLTSFEVDTQLVKNFELWCKELNTSTVYDDICRILDPEIETQQIKKILFDNFSKRPILGDLSNYTDSKKWNIICYDAFSSKTTEKLWSFDFINQFIKKHADDNCVFTTYARTGNLKRALIQNNFKLENRLGFKGKRDSTLAKK